VVLTTHWGSSSGNLSTALPEQALNCVEILIDQRRYNSALGGMNVLGWTWPWHSIQRLLKPALVAATRKTLVWTPGIRRTKLLPNNSGHEFDHGDKAFTVNIIYKRPFHTLSQ